MESKRPALGDGGGWIHLLDPSSRAAAATASDRETEHPKLSIPELFRLDRRFRADLPPTLSASLAKSLVVSEGSLRAMGLGHQIEHDLFTFPMRDAEGRIIGIRTRSAKGEKRCVPGSRLGIGIPDFAATLDPELLLICEGESDAAAALDLGFAAIARPGCQNCASTVVDYVCRARFPRIVIVADADAPGQDGAHSLARQIAAARLPASVFTPPGAKDLRAWKQLAGSSHHDLLALLDRPATA